MGFYGNIANTSKTTFSFDLVYANKKAMDDAANGDGVFLGRYVLVEYDESPITAYYNPADQRFYNDAHFTPAMIIGSPKSNVLYQDLGKINSYISFYTWDSTTQKFVGITNTSASPYAISYAIDVQAYGRGYDSTAWIKQYDVVNNKYHYVMIAELNSVVPTFHLAVDKPSETPVAPYFDRDTTNVDYYLHIQPSYGMRIRSLIDGDSAGHVSDETILRRSINWYADGQTWDETQETVPGDIYYNKAGFDKAVRTFFNTTNVKDGINYTRAKSGRKYIDGENAIWTDENGIVHSSIYEEGSEEEDTYEWYFHLPSLGNAVCQLWDNMYGYDLNDSHRYTQLATKIADDSNLVTYDYNTQIGMTNRLRDLLGYTFEKRVADIGSHITVLGANQGKIFFDAVTRNGVEVPETYYFYAYDPSFSLSTTGDYFLDTDGEYKLVNKLAITNSALYYAKVDRYTLTQLTQIEEDSLYGLIISLHKLIGTGDSDTRDLETMQGCINRVNDIIDNINLQLVPLRMLHTNSNGVIETSNTMFPSAPADSTKVLAGDGSWVSRFAKVTVDAPSVAVTEMATAANTIISDDTAHQNGFSLYAGNKWIRLNANPTNDNIGIAHALSLLAAQEFKATSDAALSNTINTDNKITIPVFSIDNAGHIVAKSTVDFYIPHSFKYVNIGASNTSVIDDAHDGVGQIVADNVVDALTFQSQNNWIKIDSVPATDTISIGHKFSGVVSGSYGLAANENIASLDTDNTFEVPYFTVDKAGHITAASTNTVILPENFSSIVIGNASNAVTNPVAAGGTLVADSIIDTLTIGASNKWLRLIADPATDTVTIGHIVSPIGTSSSAVDLNNVLNTTFVTAILGYDEAGHIVSNETKTWSLPFAFKTIQVGNQSTEVTNVVGAAVGECIADNHVDTLGLYTGNKWLNIAANRAGLNAASDDNITFSHILSGAVAGSYGDSAAQTPNFGATFKVPYVQIDAAGHVTSITEHTVTQHALSLVDDITGNVMTDLSLVPTTGVFTKTRVNVGTLLLDGYIKNSDNTDVAATDSINSAFSKLQTQVIEEEANRTTAINTAVSNLVNGAGAALDTLNELATALGNDANFATTVATNIADAKLAGTNAQANIDSHEALTNNPHAVTKAQVGLGNVINESKITMFTNPAFTGVATLNAVAIATVTDVATKVDKVAGSRLVTTAEANAITQMVELLANYNIAMSLTPPTIAINAVGAVGTLTASTYAAECTYLWLEDVGAGIYEAISPAKTANTYTATITNSYKCRVTRTHNGQTVVVDSDAVTLTV